MTTRIVQSFIVAALLLTAPAGEGAGLLIPDVALREIPEGLQLFVAHPGRGQLLSAIVPRDARAVPMSALEPVTFCGRLGRVVAVTIQGARLVAITGEPDPAVY